MQPCDNLGTTFILKLSQGCHKVVQTLSQGATMHLVTTLYFETVATVTRFHKDPKCVFLVCFLANQALHSSNTYRAFENSQLALFFSEI